MADEIIEDPMAKLFKDAVAGVEPAVEEPPAPAGDPAPAAPASSEAAPSAPMEGAHPAGDPAGAPAVETPPAAPEAPPTPAAETPPVPEAPAAPPAVEGPATPDVATDVLKQIADALKPQAPATGQPSAEPDLPAYTEDEQRVINDYMTNFADVHQAEQLLRRREYGQMLQYVFSQVADFMAPHLEQLKAIGNYAHTSELKTALPDYSPEEETKLSDWIGTQPDYLQPAYKSVMQSGTTDQVVDLFRRYRQETGAAPAARITPPAIPTPPAKTELSSDAKQAADALAPVGSERTSVPEGTDPNDFMGGWKRALAELGPKT